MIWPATSKPNSLQTMRAILSFACAKKTLCMAALRYKSQLSDKTLTIAAILCIARRDALNAAIDYTFFGVMMLKLMKKWLKKYDEWCASLGLTPENKRSCVPYKKEPNRDDR